MKIIHNNFPTNKVLFGCRQMMKSYILHSHENTPMDNELMWLLKEGDGCIVIFLWKIRPTHMQLVWPYMSTNSGSALSLFCHALAYAIAANGVCLPSSHTVLLLQCFLLI